MTKARCETNKVKSRPAVISFLSNHIFVNCLTPLKETEDHRDKKNGCVDVVKPMMGREHLTLSTDMSPVSAIMFQCVRNKSFRCE